MTPPAGPPSLSEFAENNLDAPDYWLPGWRIAWWGVVAFFVVTPPVAAVVALGLAIVTSLAGAEGRAWEYAIGGAAWLAGMYAAYRFTWRGLRRSWPEETGRLVRWTVLATVLGFAEWTALDALRIVRQASEEKAVMGNLHKIANVERDLLERDPPHLFFRYDDVFGPGRPIAELRSIAGEDYRSLYPHHAGAMLTVNLERHHPVHWESFEEDFRISDGIHVNHLPDGGTFETMWTAGELHGAFRAYTKDRRLRAEATYEHGHLVGLAWVIAPDGSRRDALAPSR
jgi:hypothetical protein